MSFISGLQMGTTPTDAYEAPMATSVSAMNSTPPAPMAPTRSRPRRHSSAPLALFLAIVVGGFGAFGVINAANEVAVAAFLEEAIAFPRIVAICAEVLEKYLAKEAKGELRDLQDVLEADAWARQAARERL